MLPVITISSIFVSFLEYYEVKVGIVNFLLCHFLWASVTFSSPGSNILLHALFSNFIALSSTFNVVG